MTQQHGLNQSQPNTCLVTDLKKKARNTNIEKSPKKKNQLCNDIGNRKLINGLGLKVLVNV